MTAEDAVLLAAVGFIYATLLGLHIYGALMARKV